MRHLHAGPTIESFDLEVLGLCPFCADPVAFQGARPDDMMHFTRARAMRLGAPAVAVVAVMAVVAGASAADSSLGAMPTLRAPAAHAGPFLPTFAPSLDGSAVEYLVLTDANMAPEFARLAAWKTAKGVPAVVRTLDDARASAVQGCDLAETVRNYLRDAYRLWGVQFVLLGGDTDIIPARLVAMKLLDFDPPISELYYSCLDGNWNGDGDAFFGEPPGTGTAGDNADFFSEVYLGRAPVSTPAEAALFVDKTLRYEQPQSGDFQHKILFLAEVLFPTTYDPGGPPPTADGALFAEEIAALLPAGMQAKKLYEALQFWPGSERLTRLDATQAIDAGYGTVVHIGHGYRYTLSVGDGSLDTGDANDFVNGARGGLFYLLNCTATAFDFESMAEALLGNPDGGATIVVGASREAFPAAARAYQRAFFEQLYRLDERRVGVAMTRSRHRYLTPTLPAVDRWTHLVYTLLGDPELPLWSGATSMEIDGVPAALSLGVQPVALTVRDADGPLENALVCFAKDLDEYRTARTGADGVALLTLEPHTSGSMDLTVTRADHFPLRMVLPVTTAGAGLVLGAIDLVDDGGVSGVGNQDGRLDAGETATLFLPLRNAGSSTRSGVVATLSGEPADVEVLQGTSAYADLPAAQEGRALSPFVVRIAPSVPDGAVVTLQLQVQHDGGSDSHRVELLVHAAQLVLASMRLDDTRAGNGSGVQDAGEEVDLFYALENRGSGTAMQVSLTMTVVDEGIEVLVDSVAVVDVAQGNTVESATALVVREADTELSRYVELRTRYLQAGTGTSIDFDLRRPTPPAAPRFGSAGANDVIHVLWDPTPEADRVGYHVYRADASNGPYVRVDPDLLVHSVFRDTGLLPSRRYYYRVTAVDRTRLESTPSVAAAASTNPPLLAGWPVETSSISASTPAVGDVDGDGTLEVVAAADQVFAWDASGIELRDADQNALTWGVFYGNREVFGSIAVADLDAAPGREIVVATWDAQARYVAVLQGDGAMLPGWPRALVPTGDALRGAQVPPVVANLDGTGAPEILLAARDGRLYGWHANGSEIADGDASPATDGVLFDTGSFFLRSAPGVADLDPSVPGQEIVFGSTNGKLHVLDARGKPLSGWPRTGPAQGELFGTLFAAGVTIADLDRDGTPELVFVESSGRLHAMHLDGSELAGFPLAGVQASSNTVVPSPAVGNLQGDGDLEIVVAGSDGRVHVFDAAGTSLLTTPIVSGAASECSPLLGDIDGDGEIEVVLGNENGLLQAWNLDSSPVDGFPIFIGAEVRATPTLDDLDGDGNADLVVASWNGTVSVWDLGVPWSRERFPWPTHRGSIHRTGEYGFAVPTPVALYDLQATYAAGSGVRISWRSGENPQAGELRWRVRRAGPFAAKPARDEPTWVVDATPVALLGGGGTVEWIDTQASSSGWYGYVVELQSEGDRVAGVVTVQVGLPSVLRLHAAVPNPFNPATTLAFEVPQGEGTATAVRIRLDVIDMRGRVVAHLLQSPLPPGRHAVTWNGRDAGGRDVPSGVYVARLRAGEILLTRKLTLLR